jgi:hypothetical protein
VIWVWPSVETEHIYDLRVDRGIFFHAHAYLVNRRKLRCNIEYSFELMYNSPMARTAMWATEDEFSALLRAEGWPDSFDDDMDFAPESEPPADAALPGDVVSGADADTMIRTVDLEDRLELIVHNLEEVDRNIASFHARRSELLALAYDWAEVAVDVTVCVGDPEPYRRELSHRTVTAEIACALRIPEQTIAAQVNRAVELRTLPNTLAALRAGAISLRHTDAIVDNCLSLPSDARAEFEAALLPVATEMTASKLKRKARILRERMHPDSIEERATAARRDRRVEFEPARDGMSWVHHYLPAEDGLQIYEAASSRAAAALGENEPRTMAQLRSDFLTQLILDADGMDGAGQADRTSQADRPVAGSKTSTGSGRSRSRRVRPTVHVTVPVLTLLGVGDEPAMLEGYGPIDADTARTLASQAPSFTRILTHPVTGTVLDIDRNPFRVPADLRRWLQVRDETCRFPGCNKRAVHSDLDHTHARMDGGKTCAVNLEHLCRRHHVMKHKCGWKVTQLPGGTLNWVSPTGRVYRTAPAVIIGPAPSPESMSTPVPAAVQKLVAPGQGVQGPGVPEATSPLPTALKPVAEHAVDHAAPADDVAPF